MTKSETSSDLSALTDTREHPIYTAHQGVQGEFPPNSIAAIETSFGWAKAVEFDTYVVSSEISGSSEVVVVHPEGYRHFVNPEGINGDGPIKESLESLLDVKARGVSVVSTLDQILDRYLEYKASGSSFTELQIELKGPEVTEHVIAKLMDRVNSSELEFSDFVVCSFCYPDETPTRLEIARNMSSDIRLWLTVRGGDFSQDRGLFANMTEVLDFANRLELDGLDITRRNLNPEIVRELKDFGFHVTCHHARTSDEIAAANALGVNSIRCDYFRGPDTENYPIRKLPSEELFRELQQLNFYGVRDWSWEIAWGIEAQLRQVDELPENSNLSSKITSSKTLARKLSEVQGAAVIDDRAQIAFRVSEDSELLRVCNLTTVSIDPKYSSRVDLEDSSSELRLGSILDPIDFHSSFLSHLNFLAANSDLYPAMKSFLIDGSQAEIASLFDAHAINKLTMGELGGFEEEAKAAGINFTAGELANLEGFAHEFLTRAGRVAGLVAFESAYSLRDEADRITAILDCKLAENNPGFAAAAIEQFEAQSLRAGKIGTLRLESELNFSI